MFKYYLQLFDALNDCLFYTSTIKIKPLWLQFPSIYKSSHFLLFKNLVLIIYCIWWLSFLTFKIFHITILIIVPFLQFSKFYSDFDCWLTILMAILKEAAPLPHCLWVGWRVGWGVNTKWGRRTRPRSGGQLQDEDTPQCCTLMPPDQPRQGSCTQQTRH